MIYHVGEREMAFAYGKSGRQYRTKEEAQKLLQKEDYKQIGTTYNYKNEAGESAYITPIRDANLKETIIKIWDGKEKSWREEIKLEVISYFYIGWLVTFKRPFRPVSCTGLKLQKPLKFRKLND